MAKFNFKVGDIVMSIANKPAVFFEVTEIGDGKVRVVGAESHTEHVLSAYDAASILRRVHQYVVCAATDIYDYNGELVAKYRELITPELLLRLSATGKNFQLRHVMADQVNIVDHQGRKIVVGK